MKIVTKKQEREMKEKTIRKLMFAILNPIPNIGIKKARAKAEDLYYADEVIIINT